MLTVLDAINKSADYLAEKEIDSPRINAELFLASILNCKRLDLYLMYDRPLSNDEIVKYRDFLKRRSSFEPIQYIIGKVEFYGIEIKISPSVLIPRPETEILVETVINNIGKNDRLKILDIGSGSGNIAIALAKNLLNAKITGIDISKDSIILARENARRLQLEDQISFSVEDIFNLNEANYTGYDIVVSNPPYVSEQDYLNVQKEIKNYEPDFAVTDFSNGYSFYKKITDVCKMILNPGGKIFFEIAVGQSAKVKNILAKNDYKNILAVKDYGNIERVISGEKR